MQLTQPQLDFISQGRPLPVVSISGGKTSGMLAALVLAEYGVEIPLLIFANTGLEHEGTYRFLEDFQSHWGVKIHCLENWVWESPGRRLNVREVPLEAAYRGPELMARSFRRKKYPYVRGCTGVLKLDPIRATLVKLRKAHKGITFEIFVGLRADEFDRIAGKTLFEGLKYAPYRFLLAERGIQLAQVEEFWAAQPFTLGLPKYLGNCVGCPLKSQRNLRKALNSEPQHREWWEALEKIDPKYPEKTIWRGHYTLEQILEDPQLPLFGHGGICGTSECGIVGV